jgi:hypothetical protein
MNADLCLYKKKHLIVILKLLHICVHLIGMIQELIKASEPTRSVLIVGMF